MAGVKITVRDKDVVGALQRLMTAGGNLSGALKNVGEELRQSTIERIRAEKTPAGEPFEPLNPLYAAHEKKGPGILRGESGQLSSIVYQLGGDGKSVEVGNNVVYGAIHQFGGEIRPKNAAALVFKLGGKVVHAQSVEMPARPYLGISAGDREAIIGIFEDFFDEATGGAVEIE